jgi:hypothetical protein
VIRVLEKKLKEQGFLIKGIAITEACYRDSLAKLQRIAARTCMISKLTSPAHIRLDV